MTKFKQIISMSAVSAVPATVVASLSVYALIENNNQGEAFNTVTGDVDYFYLVALFSISFIVIFLAFFFILLAARLISFLFDAIFGKEPPKE